MKRSALLTFLLCMMLSVVAKQGGSSEQQNCASPKDGFVPNQETAIKIAEAVLIPIYGEQAIRKQKPLVAELHNDLWIVKGTLPKGHFGGVARVELKKSDASIQKVLHGK